MNNPLKETNEGGCQLCRSTTETVTYLLPPEDHTDNQVLLCRDCLSQIQMQQPMESSHWRFLSQSMWSDNQALRVLTWRMLNRLKSETWAAENLDMMYMDDDTLRWAEAAGEPEGFPVAIVHRDVNGAVLGDGDAVVLTKSLDVKGSAINLKMGTVIRNIRVVATDEGQIEGKVGGQTLVVLTKYVRRQS